MALNRKRRVVNVQLWEDVRGPVLSASTSSDITSTGSEQSWAEPSTSDDVSSTEAARTFLVHKGRSAEMIRRSPSLAGVTLSKGWSREASEAFINAIHSLVKMNPILTGHVYDKNRDLFNSGELWIEAGTYTPDKHEFVKYIDPPLDAPDLSAMNATETLAYCLDVLMPLLDGCELTEKQIEKKLPLFEANLILLPDSHAFYSVKMSHSVGDGVTFFQVLKEISMHMNGFDVSPIDWNNPLKPTHEFYPDTFSPRDIEVSYGGPFMCGLLKNFFTLSLRHQNILLLCKDKVNRKKRELRAASGSNDVSSNDIITAALCEANQSTDIFVFTENIRGIKQGVPRHAGGNFIWEVPVSRLACANPLEVRASVSNGGYYKTGELPLQPFLCGKVGRLTSLATITEKVMFKGTEVVCQLPFLSFIKELPLDVAVIFRFSDRYWGVLHNFSQFQMSGMLSDIVSNGDET